MATRHSWAGHFGGGSVFPPTIHS